MPEVFAFGASIALEGGSVRKGIAQRRAPVCESVARNGVPAAVNNPNSEEPLAKGMLGTNPFCCELGRGRPLVCVPMEGC